MGKSMDEISGDEDGGNYYPKYTSNNPIVKFLMGNFLRKMDHFVFQVSPKSIHEVGCGEGFIISRYLSENVTLKGTDMSSRIIEVARTKYESINPQILFETKKIDDLKFVNDQAELVICSEVLEHVQNPKKTLGILAKIATKNLIISVPNEPLWRIMNVIRGKYIIKLGNTPGHVNHWSKSEIVELVNQYFSVIEIVTPIPWTIILCKRKHT